MTIRTASISAAKPRTKWERLPFALPGLPALFLTATLLAGCGKDDAGTAGANEIQSAKPESKAETEQSAKSESKAEAEQSAKSESKAEAEQSAKSESKAEAVKGGEELEAGYAAMDAKDYATAVEHFQKSADEGNADAMVMLYVCYCEGLGVKRQEEGMGDKYLKPAAETGNEIAMICYASYIMVEEHDEERGLEILEQLADNGSAYAQYSLVKLYQEARQYKKTGKYLPTLAALPLTDEKSVLDHIPGAFNNKKMFDEKAVIDLKVPTVMNKIIVSSQAALGMLYVDGADGIEPDKEKAKQWLNKAKENGFGGTDAILKYLRLE